MPIDYRPQIPPETAVSEETHASPDISPDVPPLPDAVAGLSRAERIMAAAPPPPVEKPTDPARGSGIEPKDLRAAVGAGMITERQAASLTALAHSRRGARENLAAGDEPFELFRGFNEIFIMVGLSILAFGWAGLGGVMVATSMQNIQFTIAVICVATAVVIWLVSEYFIRRRRMIGPAIMMAILWSGNATFGLVQYFAQVFMVAQEDFSSLVFPGVLSILAIFLFWLRFRVPFAMAIMASAVFVVALVAAATRSGTPESVDQVFTLSAEGSFAWITLIIGLGVFALAMAFDGSDPYRVTRRSAQGFWLHVVAAPMIVNTVALSLLVSEVAGGNGILFGFLALIAIVAIIIDRRSFLLTAIGYVVIVASTALESEGIAWLIFGLGLFMVLLGAFWEKIRALFLKVLPLGGIRRFLPPSV